MYPAHLQSSYPAETQFFATSAFKEHDLRQGRLSDIHHITQETAKMKVASPAFNTRSASTSRVMNKISTPPPAKLGKYNIYPLECLLRLFIQQPSIAGGRKRRSGVIAPSSFSGGSDDSIMTPPHIKRLRRAPGGLETSSGSLQTSYSKPGPPTPAAKSRRNGSFNSSRNTSTTSSAVNVSTISNVRKKEKFLDLFHRRLSFIHSRIIFVSLFQNGQENLHDKTPLLDRTNTSNMSALSGTSVNRSLRSRIIGTPKSLKKVMTGAFKQKRSKYSVKDKK